MTVHMHMGTKLLASSWWKKFIDSVLKYTVLSWMTTLMYIWHIYKCRSGRLSDKDMGENLILAQCQHLSICPFVAFCASNISYSTDGAGCGAENQRMIDPTKWVSSFGLIMNVCQPFSVVGATWEPETEEGDESQPSKTRLLLEFIISISTSQTPSVCSVSQQIPLSSSIHPAQAGN